MLHFFFLSFFWEDYFWPRLKRPVPPETGLGLAVPASNLTPSLQGLSTEDRRVGWRQGSPVLPLETGFERHLSHCAPARLTRWPLVCGRTARTAPDVVGRRNRPLWIQWRWEAQAKALWGTIERKRKAYLQCSDVSGSLLTHTCRLIPGQADEQSVSAQSAALMAGRERQNPNPGPLILPYGVLSEENKWTKSGEGALGWDNQGQKWTHGGSV